MLIVGENPPAGILRSLRSVVRGSVSERTYATPKNHRFAESAFALVRAAVWAVGTSSGVALCLLALGLLGCLEFRENDLLPVD